MEIIYKILVIPSYTSNKSKRRILSEEKNVVVIPMCWSITIHSMICLISKCRDLQFGK